MMSMQTDPWELLGTPTDSASLGRRIDEHSLWDFWWIKDVSSCMMLLELQPDVKIPGVLPHFRDLEVVHQRAPEGKRGGLIFRLLDDKKRDVFQSLCIDIVTSTGSASSEEEAAKAAVLRTWRWHHLLRGGSGDLLSAEEQRGLIGELHVLTNVLVPVIGVSSGIACWTGPEDSPKDFEIESIFIESKARRGAAQPFVTISSEFQLDASEGQMLYLHVLDVNRAKPDTTDRRSLTDHCHDVRERCGREAPEMLIDLERKLSRVGFRWSDDYSGFLWTIGQARVYEVRDDFPRVASSIVFEGIRNVRYDISLNACEAFAVELSAIPLKGEV